MFFCNVTIAFILQTNLKCIARICKHTDVNVTRTLYCRNICTSFKKKKLWWWYPHWVSIRHFQISSHIFKNIRNLSLPILLQISAKHSRFVRKRYLITWPIILTMQKSSCLDFVKCSHFNGCFTNYETRHACTYLNTFLMIIPNIVMISNNVDIFDETQLMRHFDLHISCALYTSGAGGKRVNYLHL